jgi:ribosome maturation factor RimP
MTFPPNAPRDLAGQVRTIADSIAATHDAYVIDVSVRGFKGSRVVTIFVDTDEGIGIDIVGKMSREIGFTLEEGEVIEGKYTLDVSSPGATKPLELPRQYPRHVGRPFAVKYRDLESGNNVKAEGTLAASDASSLTLQPDGGADPLVIAFDDVVEAKVKLPW